MFLFLVRHLGLKFLGLVDHLLNLANRGHAATDVELGIDFLQLRLQKEIVKVKKRKLSLTAC